MIEAIVVMVILGAVLGLGLGYASEKLYVQPDAAFEDVLTMLPGLNCGACGYPGCAGLAGALIDQDTDKVTLCKPSTKEQRVVIAKYLNEYFENKGLKTNIKA
jgi:electron transport complex protein RnfB